MTITNPRSPADGALASTPIRREASTADISITRAQRTYVTPEGGTVLALREVDLAIEAGEFFVLLGPSGCGKTTLLRSIAGLEILDGGQIHVGGKRIDDQPPHKRPVNTVFQNYALFPHMTVAENVAFGLQMEKWSKPDITARVNEMLELVQLSSYAHRRPSELSGGQQQRVALARAIAKSPEVLLLDEPLAALDAKLRRGMQNELKRLQQTTGITFIFVTHDQEEALSLGDRIAVFNSGLVAQVGTPEEIYERPNSRFVADFIGETNFLDAVVCSDAISIRIGSGPQITLPDKPDAAPGTTITLAIRPERISLTAVSTPGAQSPSNSPARGLDAPELCRGTVSSRIYMGSDMRCEVLTTDGDLLNVKVAAPFDSAHLEVGTAVSVRVFPEFLRAVRVDAVVTEEAAHDDKH